MVQQVNNMWLDILEVKPKRNQWCLVWNNDTCAIDYMMYDESSECWTSVDGNTEVGFYETSNSISVESDVPDLVYKHWLPAPACPYGDTHYSWQPLEDCNDGEDFNSDSSTL